MVKLWLILSPFIILTVVVVINVIVQHLTTLNEEKNTTNIKFSSFLSFYNINPDRWILEDDHVYLRRTANEAIWDTSNPAAGVDVIEIRDGYNKPLFVSSHDIRFNFSFWNKREYKRWHKNTELRNIRNAQTRREADDYESLIRIMKREVEQYEKKHKKEFRDGIDRIEQYREARTNKYANMQKAYKELNKTKIL